MIQASTGMNPWCRRARCALSATCRGHPLLEAGQSHRLTTIAGTDWLTTRRLGIRAASYPVRGTYSGSSQPIIGTHRPQAGRAWEPLQIRTGRSEGFS